MNQWDTMRLKRRIRELQLEITRCAMDVDLRDSNVHRLLLDELEKSREALLARRRSTDPRRSLRELGGW